MTEIKHEIIKPICVLSGDGSGWTKEVNLVSWNGKPAKYDIRDWAPDHEKLSKGITLSQTEWDKLMEYARTEPTEQPE